MIKRLKELKVYRVWGRLGPGFLPFADAATAELPLKRLLRLALFQLSVGGAVVLLNGTLNRVMILELGIPTWLVAAMVSLPLLFAPLRALVGHRSDYHHSFLGWRRVPYIWMGTLIQFGGLSIMPFALIILSGGAERAPPFAGEVASALAFLMVGAGMHITQTAGIALATDLAPEESRPRVVALLYVMLLLGMVVAAVSFGLLLNNFSNTRLVQVIQGAAVFTMVLNLVSLWKQEPRNPKLTSVVRERPKVSMAFRELAKMKGALRLLVVVALGTAGFNMQDILLEPYGGEVLGLSVSATTSLTALWAGGTLFGLAAAARMLSRGKDPHLLAALGCLVGIGGLSAILLAGPATSTIVFCVGTLAMGFGGGWFGVGSLIAAMGLAEDGASGLAVGAWGAVQATSAGIGIGLGGLLRDVMTQLAAQGSLGPGLVGPVTGYGAVYLLEIFLLFATLVAVGPLVRFGVAEGPVKQFGLAELPG